MDISCPRCKSLQKFGKQIRYLPGDEIEIFIRCSYCHWERVVEKGNRSIILNNRQIDRLKIRAQKDPQLKEVIRRKVRKNERIERPNS